MSVSEQNGVVTGVVGLPGSGKSALMQLLKDSGHEVLDDMNRNWNASVATARQRLQHGVKVALSDIEFCNESMRRQLEVDLGIAVNWVYFANEPWQCAKNCLYRFLFEKPDRPLQEEIQKIRRLSRIYNPTGEMRPVVRADERIPDHPNPEVR